MKNYFTASLAIAVAQAIQMGVDHDAATCAEHGDISLSRTFNQVIRIDSALGPDQGSDWYDDDDCIPLTLEQAFQRGRWVGTFAGNQTPTTLSGARRYNMWAQYRCAGETENKAYWLNVARAERCLNAWADVEGDCSTEKSMRYSTMTADLKPFRLSQWGGDYSDVQIITDSLRPGGLWQHSWEALGECEGEEFRWAANDVFQQINDGERPIFTSDSKSQECPFFEFCWADDWCTGPYGQGQADFTEGCSSSPPPPTVTRLAPHDYTANGEDLTASTLLNYVSTEGVYELDDAFVAAGPVTLTKIEVRDQGNILYGFGCVRFTFTNGIDTVITDFIGGSSEACLLSVGEYDAPIVTVMEPNYSLGLFTEFPDKIDSFGPLLTYRAGFQIGDDFFGDEDYIEEPDNLNVDAGQSICGISWWAQSYRPVIYLPNDLIQMMWRPTVCNVSE